MGLISVAADSRANLIPDEKKQHLFYLFIGWCSRSIAATERNGAGIAASLKTRDSEVISASSLSVFYY